MAMLKCCLLLYLIVGLSVSVPAAPRTQKRDEKCGYDSCTDHEPGVLNVHIVAHTHDDVGWLKTVDQYYYGSKNYIQKAGVQYILDSVVKELWEDAKRRFIYVETAFFWKWWVRQSRDTQDKVHTLVRQGRLQFVGGAWSMNDEAAAHYHSIVDQFTHGLKRLNATFGRCGIPTVGWQIDPFGHSREFASLLAGMGYDGLFLGRIDYQDKKTRSAQKSMEMVWRGDDDLGSNSDIFTSVLYNQYQPPPGFCFDILCSDEPIIDDPDSPAFNVDEKVNVFVDLVRNMSQIFVTNNVLVTMGDDFNYQDAGMWFTNLDKLIKYTNLKAAKDELGIKVFYSTPNCYLKAVKDANVVLPTKQDDFFPYASDPTAYWTGYFTSRPTTKYLERQTNTQLQMVKQLQVLTNLERHYNFVVDTLRAAMGVMQHHDAITGTEKQHVARDYVRLVTEAVSDSSIVQNQAYSKLMFPVKDKRNGNNLVFKRCALNETECSISQNSNNFIINIYNVLAWSRNHVVRIPVNDNNSEVTYTVTDPNGKTVHSFVQPLFVAFKNTYNQSHPANYELIFLSNLPPLGYINYYVSKEPKVKIKRDTDKINDYYDSLSEKIQHLCDKLEQYEDSGPKYMTKSVTKVNEIRGDDESMLGDDPKIVHRYDENEVSQILNKEKYIPEKKSKDKYSVKHSIKYYPACAGDNLNYLKRSSGAYIFRPNATQAYAINPISKTTNENIFGKEYKTILSNNVSYVVRINNDDIVPYHEIEYMIGPINVNDSIGKEFVVQHEVQIKNNGKFYTDSSGRQMIERIKDHRPQWNVSLEEPIPGNYYPIVNKIAIEDDKVKLVVLTDRSVGGTSLKNGQIEIMVHRRLLHDDAFGVDEALNETIDDNGLIVRGVHKFMITEVKARNLDEADQIRKVELSAQYEPVITFADAAGLPLVEWKTKENFFTGLNRLPKGVHILTLEQWDDNSLLLLRLENILSTDLGLPADSLIIDVNFNNIFKDISIIAVQETLLAANRIDVHNNWSWKTKAGEKLTRKLTPMDSAGVITLAPRQIRSFIVEYEFKKGKKTDSFFPVK